MPPPLGESRGALTLRGHTFAWGARTYVMGIVNVTPDSFSGDGAVDPGAASDRAAAHIAQGADLLDLGAESSRPGHTPVPASVEIERLVPAIRTIRERMSGAVLSVDTYKPEVFRAAHDAGADMLNSIWGLDDALLEAALERRVPVVVMHNKREPHYERGVVDEVLSELDRQAHRAVAAGLAPESVVLDPGIGFGKTPEHNLELLAALERLVALGFPTMVGTSRKSTLGRLTGRSPGERAFATAATVALAARAGIDIVRVHDVADMTDVVRVADAVVRGWRPHHWADGAP